MLCCTLHHNQTRPSRVRCENLLACSSAVSQRARKAGVQLQLSCYHDATSSVWQALPNTCMHTWAYAHCSISEKGQQDAVETSKHAVEAGHSTGCERVAASHFGFDAAKLLQRCIAVALHVPGADFDHKGEVLESALKMPVTALVHTEHWPPVLGFRTSVHCVFGPCVFQNI
jgi:hypothetical protein